MLPLLRYSQKRVRDIEVWDNVSNEDDISYYEWTFLDFIKCRGPVLEKKIEGVVVKYNPTTNEIFVPDLIDQKVETLSSIYLTVKFLKQYGGKWFPPFSFC